MNRHYYKTVNNEFAIDTDDLGRQYVHNTDSPYSEDSDRHIVGVGLELKEIKKLIDRYELRGYWI